MAKRSGWRNGLALLALCLCLAVRVDAGALETYVRQADSSFAWRLRDTQTLEGIEVATLELTSQTWRGGRWTHTLYIARPGTVRFPATAFLEITHSAGRKNLPAVKRLAEAGGTLVAVLTDVPNQPLYDNRYEDALIAYTFDQYLRSGDGSWPLLLPMAKSAVRAMDAVQAWARAAHGQQVERFVVSGASKRGWTTWLSAVADPRVKAIAPMVIDMLNLRPQMRYQLDTWGAYSEQIEDYTRKGLIKEGELTDREALLLRLVDPYTYRSRLTLPKLLIHGTNDPYWPVDAAKLYWNDLVGPKSLLEVANGNHGLKGGQDLAVATLAAFFRHVAGQSPWPTLQWKHGDAEGGFVLEIQSSPKPKAARLWVAHSLTKDVRQSEWASQPLADHGGGFLAKVPKPEQGHVAFFGELQFETDGLPFSLCTLVRRE